MTTGGGVMDNRHVKGTMLADMVRMVGTDNVSRLFQFIPYIPVP